MAWSTVHEWPFSKNIKFIYLAYVNLSDIMVPKSLAYRTAGEQTDSGARRQPPITLIRVRQTYGFKELLHKRITELEGMLEREIKVRVESGKYYTVPVKALWRHPDPKGEVVRTALEVLHASITVFNEPMASAFEMKDLTALCQKSIWALAPRNLSGNWEIPQK